MKKQIFIMTHPHSDWEKYRDELNKHPNIQCFDNDFEYHHPDDLYQLFNLNHKKNNSSAVWAHFLFKNNQFTMKLLCEYYNFMFVYDDLDTFKSKIEHIPDDGIKWNKTYMYQYRMSGIGNYINRTYRTSKRSRTLENPKLDKDFIFDSIFG